MPLSEIVTDFYDKLKSVFFWLAAMSYEPKGMQKDDLVRLDIMIATDLVELSLALYLERSIMKVELWYLNSKNCPSSNV